MTQTMSKKKWEEKKNFFFLWPARRKVSAHWKKMFCRATVHYLKIKKKSVAGVTDPFLQVKIIHLLRKLGVGHSNTSEEINDVLAQVFISLYLF